MKDQNNNRMGCTSLLSVLLTVVFVTLKLCNVIMWSWWWVLSPIWLYAGLAIIYLTIIVLAALIKE